MTGELTYGKWGTRIMHDDEGDDGVYSFARDGSRATAEVAGWEILPGPVQRIDDGGRETVAYLWPVVRGDGAS